MFTHSVIVPNESVTAGTSPSWDCPVSPLSHLLCTVKFAQNQANTQLTFANIALMISKLEVLYKGSAVCSLNGIDLMAAGNCWFYTRPDHRTLHRITSDPLCYNQALVTGAVFLNFWPLEEVYHHKSRHSSVPRDEPGVFLRLHCSPGLPLYLNRRLRRIRRLWHLFQTDAERVWLDQGHDLKCLLPFPDYAGNSGHSHGGTH